MKMRHLLLAMAGWVVVLIIFHNGLCAQEPEDITFVSEKILTGFNYPESVAYSPQEAALYVSQFGPELKPTLKDGKGKISKISLSGVILEEQYLPSKGGVLNKPKGIWVEGSRLWVTDIDVVWIFDLKTRKGKKALLPNAKFANAPTVVDNALYVSDTAGNKIYKVEPADFLELNHELEGIVWAGDLNFSPNGLCPATDTSIIVVAYNFSGHDQGIYMLDRNAKTKTLVENLGLLDGVFGLDDGTLLITDWKTKSLLRWGPKMGVQTLAKGFDGPADFCVVPGDNGFMVVVPDLPKSELRMIHFEVK